MTTTTTTTDFLVIGGGVVGVALARELRTRWPDQRVTVLEKEPHCGEHQSGRNSGVLHAGFYYTADSMKARLCREGNAWWQAFCTEHDLALRRCGKLVVAPDEADQPGLDELLQRGRHNGVDVTLISNAEARRIEPRARTGDRALWSPTTASLDPQRAMAALVTDAEHRGVRVHRGVRYLRRDGDTIHTTTGAFAAGHVVNAAGAYADRVAHDFGFGQRYTMLPFKGLYLYGDADLPPLAAHIYPVPDLGYPFLGVHFTVTAAGRTKIGPTALPALWREHYGGLANLRLDELLQITTLEASLLVHAAFPFRRLAITELRKANRHRLVRQAGRLLDGVRAEDFRTWGRPGIRAQLVDRQRRTLEMDFVVEGDRRSTHVLNAVSPAFTCAAPFARAVCDRIAASHDASASTQTNPAR